jgi:glyceraldehyde-3-phosphate dehydrogenase (ferredoxin)
MDTMLKILLVDASNGYYRIERFSVGDFFGPVDMGLYYAQRYNSLNIGVGLLAGSIFPGSNRLIFSGFSPCWGGFYISSMGGAGLVFDNLGINMVAITGKSATPSVLMLNRNHGEEIEVELRNLDPWTTWESGRGGIYSIMDSMYETFKSRYETDPRILAVGPAAAVSDVGAIASVPITKGEMTFVDTWAGRGGLGSKLFSEHGLSGIIYGGTVIDEDFRNRKVADSWFQDKYEKKMAAKDFESTTKYRFDPKFGTGGTFGVNYQTMGGRIMAFNYKSIFMNEDDRVQMHQKYVLDHYLKQFNEETIENKQQRTCGEPCSAVCKKMNNQYKKDYEPYQTMGPLCGIFDQRAAEKLNHHADMYGFDGISIGGVLSWLMECLDEGLLSEDDLGVTGKPVFSLEKFDVVKDSASNAQLGIALLDSIVKKRGRLDLSEGARKWGRRMSREKGVSLLDRFVYTAFGRKGWMVPNQYWTAGVLSPMPIMGKYYNYYGKDFSNPREMGRVNATRFIKELVLDNIGICRFHRKWAEDMVPEIIETLFGRGEEYMQRIAMTASRINSRNASVFWESERCFDYIVTFMKRKRDVEGEKSVELSQWIDRFEKNKKEAALDYWYEIHKGVHESLREF